MKRQKVSNYNTYYPKCTTKKAQIELTFLVMFVFVSCFPVGFNKCLETSQY
jgi:hypothetical protein